MKVFLWNADGAVRGRLFTKAIGAQELSVTVQAADGKPIHAVLRADDGIAILVVALASLLVVALALWTVLAIAKILRRR